MADNQGAVFALTHQRMSSEGIFRAMLLSRAFFRLDTVFACQTTFCISIRSFCSLKAVSPLTEVVKFYCDLTLLTSPLPLIICKTQELRLHPTIRQVGCQYCSVILRNAIARCVYGIASALLVELQHEVKMALIRLSCIEFS